MRMAPPLTARERSQRVERLLIRTGTNSGPQATGSRRDVPVQMRANGQRQSLEAAQVPTMSILTPPPSGPRAPGGRTVQPVQWEQPAPASQPSGPVPQQRLQPRAGVTSAAARHAPANPLEDCNELVQAAHARLDELALTKRRLCDALDSESAQLRELLGLLVQQTSAQQSAQRLHYQAVLEIAAALERLAAPERPVNALQGILAQPPAPQLASSDGGSGASGASKASGVGASGGGLSHEACAALQRMLNQASSEPQQHFALSPAAAAAAHTRPPPVRVGSEAGTPQPTSGPGLPAAQQPTPPAPAPPQPAVRALREAVDRAIVSACRFLCVPSCAAMAQGRPALRNFRGRCLCALRLFYSTVSRLPTTTPRLPALPCCRPHLCAAPGTRCLLAAAQPPPPAQPSHAPPASLPAPRSKSPSARVAALRSEISALSLSIQQELQQQHGSSSTDAPANGMAPQPAQPAQPDANDRAEGAGRPLPPTPSTAVAPALLGRPAALRSRSASLEAGMDEAALVERAMRDVGPSRESDADAVVAALASRLKAEQQARLETEEQAATMLAHEEASITILEARVRDLQAKLAAVRDGRAHVLAGTPLSASRTPSPSAALATLERRHDLSMRAMSALSASPAGVAARRASPATLAAAR